MQQQDSEQTCFSQNQYGEKYLFAVNQISFDRYDSASIFKSHFRQNLFDKDTFNVIIGTDSGLLVDYTVRNRKEDNSIYFFVELPEIIEAVRTNCDLTEAKGVYLFSAEEWESELEKSAVAQFIYKNKLRFYESLGAWYEYLDSYHKLKFAAHAVLERVSFLNRVTLGSENFIVRQLQNICENRLPALALEGNFKGCTCILLAGGPSLDECIDWVKAHRQQLVVIAVSRIAKRLQQVSLVPDIVVCVDPFDDSFDVSKEVLAFSPDVVLVNSYHVVPKLLGQWSGPSIYLGARFPWRTRLNPSNFVSAGPTVTNTALSFALGAGFSQILLAGVDLCFSPEGYTHAKGSIETAHGPLLTTDGLWVKTNAGDLAETSFPLATARERIETVLAEDADEGVEVLNLAYNGARIKGAEFKRLEDLHLGHDPLTAKEAMKLYCNSLTDKKIHESNLAVLAELCRVERDLKAVVSLSVKAIAINQALYRTKHKGSDEANVAKLHKIQRKLDKDFSYLAKLLKTYGLSYFVAFMDPGTLEDWDDERLEESGRLYYRAYQQSAEGLLELISEAINRTQVREEELRATPDFKRMFSTWREDKQYARAVFWSKRHELSSQAPDIIQEFEAFFTESQRQIHATDTEHAKTIKKQTSVENIEHKVAQLYAKRDLGGLQKLSSSLARQTEQNEARQSLQSLICGYIHALSGDNAKALQAFEQTKLEAHRSYALNQIVGLSLGQKEFARGISALRELSELSPRYLPKLAHLQYLTGDQMAAVDSYNRYLMLFGEDTHVWLSLAKLFLELGAIDSARIACDFILSLEPENKLALAMMSQLGERGLE